MAPQPAFLSLLQRAAPRLTRHFFTVRECPRQNVYNAQWKSFGSELTQCRSRRQSPFLQAFRSQSTAASSLDAPASLSQLGNAVKDVGKLGNRTAKRSSFPKTSSRLVAYYLFGSAASVFGMVVLGGLTRLTESGLSITEWRPVTGTLPPLTASEWDIEFNKYRRSPEFQQLNPNMTLEEFRKIFYMEYAHRLWGRVIGLTAIIPTIYFVARRQVSVPVARNLIMITGLIGFQGFVGWWMVKSGLKDDLFAKGAHPRVSQYRLATHLSLAFAVYLTMVWNGLQILRERHLFLNTQPQRAMYFIDRLASLTVFRRSVLGVTALVALTAFSGAFVAGLDAGLIYNEFPYMGTGLTPPKSELFSEFYSRLPAPHTDLWWRNMFENPSLVQLDHRILATTTFVAVNALFLYARFSPALRSKLTKGTKTALSGALFFVWMQATLGLTTLLYLVPLPLASAHQAGSLALLTSMMVLGSRVWTPPRLARMVKQRLEGVRFMQETTRARKQKRALGLGISSDGKTVHKTTVLSTGRPQPS